VESRTVAAGVSGEKATPPLGMGLAVIGVVIAGT
jgi:hypothetical protein